MGASSTASSAASWPRAATRRARAPAASPSTGASSPTSFTRACDSATGKQKQARKVRVLGHLWLCARAVCLSHLRCRHTAGLCRFA